MSYPNETDTKEIVSNMTEDEISSILDELFKHDDIETAEDRWRSFLR